MVKKLMLVILLIFLFSVPQMQAQKFGIKTVFGSLAGQRPEDNWIHTADYYDMRITPASNFGSGMDVTLELFYHVIPEFYLSVGVGYLEKNINAGVGEFSYPSGSGYQGGFKYSPEMNSNIIPITLTAGYIHRLNEYFVLNIMAGGGYYTGEVKSLQDNFARLTTSSDLPFGYLPEFFKADLEGTGFHFGLGLDINLSENTYFLVESFYKHITFSDLKSETLRDVDQSAAYLEQYPSIMMIGWRISDENLEGNLLYQLDKIKFTGFQVRAGLKFRF